MFGCSQCGNADKSYQRAAKKVAEDELLAEPGLAEKAKYLDSNLSADVRYYDPYPVLHSGCKAAAERVTKFLTHYLSKDLRFPKERHNAHWFQAAFLLQSIVTRSLRKRGREGGRKGGAGREGGGVHDELMRGLNNHCGGGGGASG